MRQSMCGALTLLLTAGFAGHTAAAVAAMPAATLINRAIASLEQQPVLNTVSTMIVTVNGKIVYQERVHFVLKRPQSFQSDLTEETSGSAAMVTKVISDGSKVWTYQPPTNTYSVATSADFEQDDIGGLGLFGTLLVNSISNSVGNELNIKALEKGGGKLEEGQASIDGVVYPEAILSGLPEHETLTLVVNPTSLKVVRLTLTEPQSAGRTVTVQETVQQQSTPSSLPEALFYFSPPPAATRVKLIPIGPF